MTNRTRALLALTALLAFAGCTTTATQDGEAEPTTTTTTVPNWVPVGAVMVEPGVWATQGRFPALHGQDCDRLNQLVWDGLGGHSVFCHAATAEPAEPDPSRKH